MNGCSVMRKSILLLFLISCCTIAPGVAAMSRQPVVPNDPIRIQADRLEAYNDEALVVFAGKVEALQGSMVITCNRLKVYYRQPDGEKKATIKEKGAVDSWQIEKMEAEGAVVIRDELRTVTGDSATFLNSEQKIIITGATTMQEGRSKISGGKITLLLGENKGIVESPDRQRVSATIYPK